MVFALPAQAIGIGAGVGIVLALFGSFLVRFCGARGWISGAWTGIPVAALAMLCFALSQWLGGSGFIGAFVGGLLFGGLIKGFIGAFVGGLLFGGLIKGHEVKEELLRGAEGLGNVMSLLTWFVFGAVAFGYGLQNMTWQVIIYALLSLTVIRIAPVMLCLVGVNMRFDSKLFLGWFGPRGLASIVFIVMVIGEDLPGGYLHRGNEHYRTWPECRSLRGLVR
jgi:NhaP-type Na+/H+ or K+/H+ antiporter